MRGVIWGSLVLLTTGLTACSVPELSAEGSRVAWSASDPAGCRSVSTLREAEGGGLRTYARNRAAAETRIRNEAARTGANAVVLLTEVHGDSEEGAEAFASGVAGLTTSKARCSNCVLLTARAYSCAALPAAEPAPRAAPPRYLPAEPEPALEPVPPAAPAAPPPPPALPPPVEIQTPGEPPVIILLQPQK
jgi:hypothetical protein